MDDLPDDRPAAPPDVTTVLDRAFARAQRWPDSAPAPRPWRRRRGWGERGVQPLTAAGRVMPSASVWHGCAVIRFSVSSWRTGPAEVRETVEAVARAATAASPAAVGEGAR